MMNRQSLHSKASQNYNLMRLKSSNYQKMESVKSLNSEASDEFFNCKLKSHSILNQSSKLINNGMKNNLGLFHKNSFHGKSDVSASSKLINMKKSKQKSFSEDDFFNN